MSAKNFPYELPAFYDLFRNGVDRYRANYDRVFVAEHKQSEPSNYFGITVVIDERIQGGQLHFVSREHLHSLKNLKS